jgi:hypothetical protein
MVAGLLLLVGGAIFLGSGEFTRGSNLLEELSVLPIHDGEYALHHSRFFQVKVNRSGIVGGGTDDASPGLDDLSRECVPRAHSPTLCPSFQVRTRNIVVQPGFLSTDTRGEDRLFQVVGKRRSCEGVPDVYIPSIQGPLGHPTHDALVQLRVGLQLARRVTPPQRSKRSARTIPQRCPFPTVLTDRPTQDITVGEG